jgi:multidrug efflux system outer membrane protein
LGASALAACAAGQSYQAPALELPARYVATEEALPDAPRLAANAPVDAWWTTLGDAQLSRLTDRAIANNLDLRVAEARIRQARAQRRIARADFYPQLNASGHYTRARNSINGYTAGGSATAAQAGATSSTTPSMAGAATAPYNLWQAGLDANWEIDLFGRVRRNVEAASADLQAQQENRNGVILSVTSDVVGNYIELRGAQREIQIARENLEAQRRSVAIARTRYEAGLTTELDVAQAESQAADTEASIPPLESMLRVRIHAIAILLGEQPSALSAEFESIQPIPQGPEVIPIGVPADVLRRRPDVREAEREIAAATARSGSAMADLFPKLLLTGSAGLLSRELDTVVAGDSIYYAVGPALTWPIFDGGRIRGRIDVQDALAQQAQATYKGVVLGALRDVQDALIELSNERARRASLEQSVRASERSLRISNELYTQGLTTFLNVIEAQRAFFTAQNDLAVSEQQTTIDLIQLYRALGGGWQTRTEQR